MRNPLAARKPVEFTNFPISFADAQRRGAWRAVGKYAVDGDTIDVFVDKGFYEYQYLTVRVADINTPELVGVDAETLAKAQRAQEFTRDAIVNRALLIRPQMLNSGQGERQTFDRFVADVATWQQGTWVDLAGALIVEGLTT